MLVPVHRPVEPLHRDRWVLRGDADVRFLGRHSSVATAQVREETTTQTYHALPVCLQGGVRRNGGGISFAFLFYILYNYILTAKRTKKTISIIIQKKEEIRNENNSKDKHESQKHRTRKSGSVITNQIRRDQNTRFRSVEMLELYLGCYPKQG